MNTQVVLYGLVFTLIPLGLGYAMYSSNAAADEQIEKSVDTEGVILENSIDKRVDRDYDDDDDRYEADADSDQDTRYVFDATYRYTVNGRQYTSDGVLPTNHDLSLSTRESAESYKQKYPTENPVTVNYVPANPQKSYLEEGSDDLLIILAFLSIFVLVGISTILRGLGVYGDA